METLQAAQRPRSLDDKNGIIQQDPISVDPELQSSEKTTQHREEETLDNDAQAGVQQAEAIAIVWSKRTLILVYVLIWIVFFVELVQQNSASALTPWVTSAFQSHSLTPTVGIISSVIAGVCNLTIAKILDVFGRAYGYAMGIVITTAGLIMMAATRNVEMYAAAQVFWSVGNTALQYTLSIIVADTSTLRNRGLMTSLTASPNLITIWLGGPIAEAFLKGPGWQWAFSFFCIFVPVLCTPLLVVLLLNVSKAKKQGLIRTHQSHRSPTQSFLHYAREFDAIGLLLASVGFGLFLVPFNLWSLQPEGWKSPLIICLLVFGFVFIAAFAIWERFFAPVTFIPFALLSDRTVAGACILGTVLFVSFFCWNSYFSSFLQVVNDLSVTEASYVTQIYGLGSGIFAIVTGVAIRYTGRFKAMTLYVAIPVYALFMGLMIHFRQPGMNIGYIIMCQIFMSFAAGTIMTTPAVAAMSAASHQHVAVVMAVVSMFSSIGGAVGLTVAGVVWQNVFPGKLLAYLPLEDQENFLSIYGSLEAQLMYPIGSPTRVAIQHAYADAQAMMLVTGTAVWVAGFVGVAIWRDTNVKNMKQVKGTVF